MGEDATGCRVADSVFWHIGGQKRDFAWEGCAKIDVDMFQFAGGSPRYARYIRLLLIPSNVRMNIGHDFDKVGDNILTAGDNIPTLYKVEMLSSRPPWYSRMCKGR